MDGGTERRQLMHAISRGGRRRIRTPLPPPPSVAVNVTVAEAEGEVASATGTCVVHIPCSSCECAMTLFTCKVASIPGSATESELTGAMRTFRYHYLCKFYLPMYRALRWGPPAERHYQQQPFDAVGLGDDKKAVAGVASTQTRPCSRLIERSTFHRELLRSRPTGHEKRCWSLEEGDAERWRQNRTNKKKKKSAAAAGVFSKSDRNLPTVEAAAATGKHCPFASVKISDHQQQLTRSHSLALASTSNPTTSNLYGASISSCRSRAFTTSSSAICCRSSYDRLGCSQQKVRQQN